MPPCVRRRLVPARGSIFSGYLGRIATVESQLGKAALQEAIAHLAVGAVKSLITIRSWWASGLKMTIVGGNRSRGNLRSRACFWRHFVTCCGIAANPRLLHTEQAVWGLIVHSQQLLPEPGDHDPYIIFALTPVIYLFLDQLRQRKRKRSSDIIDLRPIGWPPISKSPLGQNIFAEPEF